LILLAFSKEETKNKQFKIFAILLPIYSFVFLIAFVKEILSIPMTLNIVLINLSIFLLISIGLILRSNFMRILTLWIIYLSIFFLLINYIEQSMTIREYYQDDMFMKEYGINYSQLIYPKVLLKFFSILFAIPMIGSFFIYLLSNKEVLELYSVSHKSHLREFSFLLLISISISILYIYILIEPKRIDQSKIFDEERSYNATRVELRKRGYIVSEYNASNQYIQIKLPKAKPFIPYSYNATKPVKSYKIEFKENNSSNR